MLFVPILASYLVQASNDTTIFRAHVAGHASDTFRNASGNLQYPYLVPGGPYNQSWDWDSVFMGVALAAYGATPYFIGTFKNFLAAVNLTTGELPGCVTPTGSDPALYHAKPMVIQAAWLASQQSGGSPEEFSPYAPAMRALLRYWNSTNRIDTRTGLHRWHDQLETGCDNLVYSQCPGGVADCWTESQSLTLASPDLEVWIAREHQAYAKFVVAWKEEGWEDEVTAAEDVSINSCGTERTLTTIAKVAITSPSMFQHRFKLFAGRFRWHRERHGCGTRELARA